MAHGGLLSAPPAVEVDTAGTQPMHCSVDALCNKILLSIIKISLFREI